MTYAESGGDRWLRRIVAGEIIASTLVGGYLIGQSLAEDAAHRPAVSRTSAYTGPSQGVAAANTPAAHTPTCLATPAASFTAVHRLLAEPGINYESAGMADPSDNGKETAPAYIQKQQIAKELGLHIFAIDDYSGIAFDGPISREAGKSYADPTAYYLAATRRFMKQLHVTIGVGIDPKDTAEPGSRRPTAAELASKNTKMILGSIVDAFYDTPEEYSQALRLRRIQLVSGTEGAAAYEVTSQDGSALYLDVDNPLNTEVIRHERAHAEDEVTCGSPDQAANDPEFTGLNGLTDPYDPRKHQLNSFTVSYQKYMDNPKHSFENKDGTISTANWCKRQAVIAAEGATIQTYSDYHPNVVEDKAETEKNVTDPYEYPVFLDKRFPILQRKFMLSLARLYTISPRVASYFIRTRNESVDTSPAGVDC